MNVLEKVRSIHDGLRAGGNPGRAADDWALAARLLGRLTPDAARVAAVTSARDLDGLAALLDAIEGKVAAAASAPAPVFPEAEMARALRAFRKQLSVSRLADESKLGGRYTSGGRKSGIDAMRPPDGFPEGIWAALAKAGRLRDLGGGFYGDV